MSETYNSGTVAIPPPLSGTEKIVVDNGGAVITTVTTQQIANLAGAEVVVNTAVTTVGNGVLTAAALTGGLISRTGPVGAFTDTTDTAAAIIAAMQDPAVGQSFEVQIKNLTAFPQTLQGGIGVTLAQSPIIPPNSTGDYLFVITGAGAIGVTHISTPPLTTPALEIVSVLATVGAAVIPAADIAGGVLSRTGAQANTAFADTTDTAVAIILAMPNVHVGYAWEFTYQNTTNSPVTIGGGLGVTVSGITVVPAGCTARFLVTYTVAATITMVGFMLTAAPVAVSGTFVATATVAVVVPNVNITANSTVEFGLKTIGGTPAGAPYMSAVTPGTGFSVKVLAGDTSTYNYRIVG